MEKKEVSNKKYIFFVILAMAFVLIGFALKSGKKTELSGSIEQREPDPTEERQRTDQILTVDGVAISSLGYHADTDVELYYDYSQVPLRVDGENMKDNQEWLGYYAQCRNADAFVCDYNLGSGKSVNMLNLSGKIFHIPFSLADLPEVGTVNDIEHSVINSSERFMGLTFCNNFDGFLLPGNKIYVQTYPGTDTVNAVSIDAEGMQYEEDPITAEIAGIYIGMKESDVIQRYGEGTQSSNFVSMKLQKEHGITASVFHSTIYKNGTGILVVTYNEERCVTAVSLYTDVLHRDLSEEKWIEVNEDE